MTLTAIAGSANPPLAASIAHELGMELCERTMQRFADGELHVEVEQSVRGHDVYVIEPTSHPVDEHVMELLFLADACRRAGAARLTAVVPYFGTPVRIGGHPAAKPSAPRSSPVSSKLPASRGSSSSISTRQRSRDSFEFRSST